MMVMMTMMVVAMVVMMVKYAKAEAAEAARGNKQWTPMPGATPASPCPSYHDWQQETSFLCQQLEWVSAGAVVESRGDNHHRHHPAGPGLGLRVLLRVLLGSGPGAQRRRFLLI